MNLIQIIEENALTYYREIAYLLHGQVVEQEEVIWFCTGRTSLARFNGVLHTAVPLGHDLAARLDPILQTFRAQKLPFFWVDWPAMGTPGLAEYLNSKDMPLLKFSTPAMYRSLADLPPRLLPQEVEMTQVQTEQDQADWLAVLIAGFEEPEVAHLDFQEYLANSLTESPPVFAHFLARWQGRPCAISTLLRARESAGIYHVTTLPAYRGRGLGRALTLAAMQAGYEVGYDTAVLFATPSGFPLYQRLGFATITTADLYIWNGAS